jgi:hypothetical protein
MEDRHKAPTELPPNPALILHYLADAQPNAKQFAQPGAAEQRTSTVRALHALYRQWSRDVVAVSEGLSLEE